MDFFLRRKIFSLEDKYFSPVNQKFPYIPNIWLLQFDFCNNLTADAK
jgi:hypothetical protein